MCKLFRSARIEIYYEWLKAILFPTGFLMLQLMFLIQSPVFSQNLTLPKYYITIDPIDLLRLNGNPNSNDYYDAEISINDSAYECGIRFRGASARTLPKKSWKLKFQNNNNPFKAQKINFNSQYRDKSIIRNFLTNSLFNFLDQPASQIYFANLFINGKYYGVFEQIEEVEENFLKRNNFNAGSIYKARSHAANFAPIPEYKKYFYPWDKQVGDKENYSDLVNLLNKIYYMPSDEFADKIGNYVNISNILSYFAIQFTIVSFDSFTKNYSLFIDSEGENSMLFPWDNDATFGNFWTGQYKPEYVYNIDGNKDQNWACLRFNVLFQRLMEYENWRREFNDKIDRIITGGFDNLRGIIDSTYALISNDYHRDANKGYTNSVFDSEKNRLKEFLNQRKAFLSGKELFHRIRFSDYYCSNPFLKGNGFATFSVKLSEPADVYLDYITDYGFGGDRDYNVTSIQLYDDGGMQDVAANDLIYSTNIYLPKEPGGA